MLRSLLKGLIALIVIVALILLWAATVNKPRQVSFDHYSLPNDIHSLQQNWTADIRQQMSHTSFGSKILPVDWFLNLEQATSTDLISAESNMSQLGFIPQNHATNNTYGLPLGFSTTEHRGDTWFGLTCTACHTGLVSYQGKKILIDGGAALLNFSAFEKQITESLRATINSADKYMRFAERMNDNSETALKQKLQARLDYLDKRLIVNQTDTPYGPGRLDAFGIIFNAIAAEALDMPSNIRPPDAPVSIPVLWDSGHFDVVQWNGSAPNKEPGPLGQNVPTALAVYGDIDMKSPNAIGAYQSSVEIKHLGYLQKGFAHLIAPQWPEKILGTIDKQLAARGKPIYHEHCKSCHLVNRNTKLSRQISTTLVDIKTIGTDPAMATNFADRRVSTGKLEGKPTAIIVGEKFGRDTQPVLLVLNAAIGAMLNNPLDTVTAAITEFQPNVSASVDFSSKSYKARPLNGIWSSAPYLHNGSIPTLWNLLQKQEQRPIIFPVGSHELDTIHVGFIDEPTENSFFFDTRLYGNSNHGHLYGTQLEDEQKWALIEYLKTL